MMKYKCKICGYETNKKTHFDRHVNKKKRCKPDKIHGNFKKIKTKPKCTICGKEFTSIGGIKYHMSHIHNGNGVGNNNNAIAGNNNNTNCNNTVNIHNTYLVGYDQYDIFDLTLFEQYVILTNKKLPYLAILDHFNFNINNDKYHNIHYGDISRKSIKIYDGNQWIHDFVQDVIEKLIASHTDVIYTLYARFRIFLTIRSTDVIADAYYAPIKPFTYNKLSSKIKYHLYHNNKIKKNPNNVIPTNRSDEIFWALSKNFNWNDVEILMQRLDNFDVDFSKNMSEIKNEVIEKIDIDDKPQRKLFKRIDQIIADLENSIAANSSSESISINSNSESTSINSNYGDDEISKISEILS